MASTLGGRDWSESRVLAAGEDWFVNWADTPGALAGPGGFFAHWLVERPELEHSYDAWTAILPLATDLAPDASRSVARPLHEDTRGGEHGFVSAVALPDGFFSVWLDGRATAAGGDMALMARTLPDGPERVLDDRVCTCCPTSAVTLADGSVLVAYRDRGEAEVRDISVVHGFPGDPASWSAPRSAHDDGWVMPGCPVNGPALAANGAGAIALAWFTMGRDATPRVKVAFATDGEPTKFGWPIVVDEESPFGRVVVAALPSQFFLVGWLARAGEGAEWRVRVFGPQGRMGETIALGSARGDRADGFLSLAAAEDGVWAAWTDGEARTVRLARVREE